MVFDLELQSAVQPVKPLGTIHVHGRIQLQLDPVAPIVRFVPFVFVSLHSEVWNHNLQVEQPADEVGDQDDKQDLPPWGDHSEKIHEPHPIKDQTDELWASWVDFGFPVEEQQKGLQIHVDSS